MFLVMFYKKVCIFHTILLQKMHLSLKIWVFFSIFRKKQEKMRRIRIFKKPKKWPIFDKNRTKNDQKMRRFR